MPTEYNNGQIYLHDYDNYNFPQHWRFSKKIEEQLYNYKFNFIEDLYNFGFIYEEEIIKSKNKAVLDNE
jgi:hypothetical protein